MITGEGADAPAATFHGSTYQNGTHLSFCDAAGSFTSLSPAGSFTGRHPQTGAYLDGFEAPSSPRYSFADPINMGAAVTFEAPELPEETLMEVRSRLFLFSVSLTGTRREAFFRESGVMKRSPVHED